MLLKFIIKILITNIPILFPVIVEPEKYSNLFFWSAFALYLFVTSSFYYQQFLGYKDSLKDKMDLLLNESFFKRIRPLAGNDTLIFIMLPRFNFSPFYGRDKFFRKCLFPATNIKQILGFNIICPINAGVQGISFKEKKLKVVDFDKARKETNYSWNMSAKDLKLIGDYRSGIATPLRNPQDKNHILGVFVIYSPKQLHDTLFEEDSFQKYFVKISRIISELIQ